MNIKARKSKAKLDLQTKILRNKFEEIIYKISEMETLVKI